MKNAVAPLLLALSACTAVPALGADWYAYESDHFTLYSDANRNEVLNTLENFEVFRKVALATLNLPDADESESLRIVMFLQPRDFDRFTGGERLGGFFYHSVFGPRMMVGPSFSAEFSQRTLFHEYVHYLMNQRSSANYPRWYSEGLAQVLEMTEIESNRVTVGKPQPPSSRRMPLDEVIDLSFDEMDYGFYYTAWLFTHYLMIDSADAPERKTQTIDFIRRFDAGEDPVAAFPESFGMSVSDMERELSAHARSQRFTVIEFPGVSYDGKIDRRELEAGEHLYVLGDLAVELSRYDAVEFYFDELAAEFPGSPFTVKARSRRAISLIHQDDVDEGDALMKAIIDGQPDDADTQADIAHYAYDRFTHAAGSGEYAPERYLERAIEFGRQAVSGNPQDLEALFYLGLSYERNGQLQEAANTLLESYDINPSVIDLNLNLARVMIKGNQHDLGMYLINRAFSAAHTESLRDRISEIRTAIDAEDFDVDDIDEIL